MRREQPFPHVILEGFASPAELAAVNAGWPDSAWPGWVCYQEDYHHKQASDLAAVTPCPCAALLARMAAVPVAWFGWPDAVPDLGLYGAGLHELRRGQRVGTHLDASHHARLGLVRRLTALLYLSPCEGGELELWDQGMSEVTATIAPVPGRLVLVGNGERSWHSVAPVTGELPRRSLALFFYDVGPGARRRPRAQFVQSFGRAGSA